MKKTIIAALLATTTTATAEEGTPWFCEKGAHFQHTKGNYILG